MASVTVEGVTAYLGLGSNLGRREENLAAAIRRLVEGPVSPVSHTQSSSTHGNNAIEFLRSSAVYQTSPWGLKDQPDFLNCVIEVGTQLPPAGLLERAKEVEESLGRQPGLRYGPRLIDVDILLYSIAVVDQPDLQIPHPRLHQRAFALIPLAELEPGLIHPVLHLTVGQLAQKVDGRDGVKIWGPPPVVVTGGSVNVRRITP